MAQKITAAELANKQNQLSLQLIDICSPTEYAAGRHFGAINIPMEQIESRIGDLSSTCSDLQKRATRRGYGSARRTAEAKRARARRRDSCMECHQSPGDRQRPHRWSVERQVRLGADLLVIMGIVLWFIWSRGWIALSAFVGLGLTFSGLTDICGMAWLLAKMPGIRPEGFHPHVRQRITAVRCERPYKRPALSKCERGL